MGIRTDYQQALYSILAPIVAPVPVYDHVPPNAPYPYVTIGNDNYTDVGDSCSRIWDIDTQIRTYTGDPQRGHIANKALQDLIADNLPEMIESLEIPGYSVAMGVFVDSYVDRDGDGLSYFGSLSFRIVIEEL